MPVARNVWQQMSAGRPCVVPALDHREHFAAVEAAVGELPPSVEAAEEGSAPLVSDAGSRDVGVEVLLGLVMGGNLVALAALLVEPEPESFALLVVVLNVHADDGADACEAVDHDADERPVAQTRDGGRVDGRRRVHGPPRR